MISMKYLFFTPLVLTFFVQANAQTELPMFDNNKYLKQCGGRAYPKCDSAEFNQKTIYDEAKKLAISTNRHLLLIIGGDWCPPCLILDQLFKSHPDQLAVLNQKYVLAKLDDRSSSFQKLESDYAWPGTGVPNMILIDLPSDRALLQYTPWATSSSVKEVQQGLENHLAKFMAPIQPVAYKWYPDKNEKRLEVFGPSLSLLLRPIDLNPGIPNLKPKVSLPTGPNQEKALAFYNQGLFHLFGYHWVDAARSFRQALLLEPQFYSAYLTLSMALDELYYNYGEDETMRPLMAARQVQKVMPRLPGEISFARYLETKSCIEEMINCKLYDITLKVATTEAKEMATRKILKVAHAVQDANLLVLAGIYSDQALLGALKINPQHPGAHHYLIHSFENQNQYRQAVEHAREFQKLAPQLAHASHMYGHVLPKIGKWQEAVGLFQQADQLHQRWFAANDAKPWEDWHYEHNLDLLAHSYFFGQRWKEAEATWERRCAATRHIACGEYYNLLILIGRSEEVFQHLKNVASRSWKALLPERADQMISEELLSLQNLANLMKATNQTEAMTAHQNLAKEKSSAGRSKNFELWLGLIANPKTTKTELDQMFASIQKELAEGGFDSWSAKMFEVEFLKRLAQNVGLVQTAKTLELTKQSVGFRCR
ncbi:MAG: thioredoxin family protein [Bdellovibrionales bacterium]